MKINDIERASGIARLLDKRKAHLIELEKSRTIGSFAYKGGASVFGIDINPTHEILEAARASLRLEIDALERDLRGYGVEL